MGSGKNIELKAPQTTKVSAAKSEITGTEIDFSGDEIRFKVLTAPFSPTIINPVLGWMVLIELSGVYAVTLPASVVVFNGDYCPNLGPNKLWLYCSDAASPEYLAAWTQEI